MSDAKLVGSAAYRRRKPGVNYEPMGNVDTCRAPKCDTHDAVLIGGHCAPCIRAKITKPPGWWIPC